jgi:hypothetical protein
MSVRRLWIGFIAVLVLTVAAELLVAPEPHFAVERLFGWNAIYGFLACAAMILFAKALGRAIKRPDDYYDG